MVKANAYGHGAITITKECEQLGAVGVGVADIHEASFLRQEGYQGEILCLGALGQVQFKEALKYDIVLTIHSFQEMETLEGFYRSSPSPLRVHIEIETGMHRLGIEPEHWTKCASILAKMSKIRVEGIFTHLAESENPTRQFTEEQLNSFEKASNSFEKILKRKLIRHVANSGAILNHKKAHLDWVRPGILLYGYPPTEVGPKGASFIPILEWRAPIIQIKRIASGESVGYNRAFCATIPMTIGTIAVGYGDGYRRGFQKIGVGFKGKRCRILGNICMDLMMIDVSSMGNVNEGDEVFVLGRGEQGEPSARELAQAVQTIPYEVTTGIGRRVIREVV